MAFQDRIAFRISRASKAQIKKAASSQGMTVSEFASQALIECANRVLEGNTVQLGDRDRDVFLSLLDAQPTPNAALSAAARRHNQRIIPS